MEYFRKALLQCIFMVSLLCAAAAPCPARDTTTVHDLGQLLEPYLPENTDWALTVVDLETGKPVLETGNSLQERLIPASLMKLITTGAVLDHTDKGGAVHKVVTLRKKVAVKGKKSRKGRRKATVLTRHVVKIRDKRELFGLLHDMNVHSRNSTAQTLASSLGEQRFGAPGNRVKGNRAVSSFLNSLYLPAKEATVADGCGLNRDNRFTVGYIANYLYQVSKKPWYDTFRATLPRPGLEGTVKRIGYTDERFRVKTGYLNDVYALAGYGVNASGREFSFAFIINGKNGRIYDRKRSRGELIRLLAEDGAQQTALLVR